MTLSLKTKLAAALREMERQIISYDEAKRKTAEEIIARFEFDHDPIPKAEGGSDHHSNIVPRLKMEHREKTKADIARIAKNKRVHAKHLSHLERMKQK